MATLQEKITEAENAYHDLLLGKSVVEVHDSNGETIRFTPANQSRLASYIQELKRQAGETTTGPMGVWL